MTTPPPPPPPESYPPVGGGSAAGGDDKTWAMLAHFGIAIFGFLAPLIIFFVKGESPWVKNESAKAFNFTICLDVVWVVLWGVRIVAFADPTGIASLIGCFVCVLLLAAIITRIAFGVINGIKVNNGEETKYPFEIPILK
jgi:uncharacterized Tic20 family protein